MNADDVSIRMASRHAVRLDAEGDGIRVARSAKGYWVDGQVFPTVYFLVDRLSLEVSGMPKTGTSTI